MTDIKDFRKDPTHALWEQLDDVRAGMLGVEGSGQHMQPMSHYTDRASGKIYFLTSDETDLVKAIGDSAVAHFCVTSTDQDFYACIKGKLSLSKDDAKIDEYWNKVAAAWFEDGRRDPHITLLEFDLDEAALWASTGNPLVFGLEIAKANMNKEKQPDVGEHTIVHFSSAA